MIGIILALGDIIATFLVVFYLINFFPVTMLYYVALYLIIKGVFFIIISKDFASFVDVVFGIYFLIVLSGIYSNTAITVLAAVWLFQKAILGLV